MARTHGVEEWKEEFSVGIEEIDRQHKHVLNLVGELRTHLDKGMAPHGVRAVMEELMAFTKDHFKFEEDLMFAYNYEDAASHREGHRYFLAQLKGMISDKKSFNHAEVRQVLRFLENWLVGHISLEDQAYAGFVNTISDEDFQRFLDKRDPSLLS